ncbi:5'/3'-nucleotidase SurE [uncultured Sphingomonas sp.]|uniref:5'/3'-nucleotidase SurE n=1 Tax=uncultured Sphingomonas sp. TaxID=158754 RepID=UPI0035C98774
MRILLTNDDGYHAPGLAALETIAATLSDDVWIVAPADEQSGAARSLTLSRPLRVRRFGERRFAVAGTPTDAVLMALGELMDAKPDLILSGVNRGGNLAEDVLYSGTVAAAMEGAMAGIRSIALSQLYDKEGVGNAVSFATAEAWGERVLRPILTLPSDPLTLVNINFPVTAPDAVKGIRVVAQGHRDHGQVRMDHRTDPRGFDYYWLAMRRESIEAGVATDLQAVAADHIAVTPLHLDLTHRGSLAMLAQAYG